MTSMRDTPGAPAGSTPDRTSRGIGAIIQRPLVPDRPARRLSQLVVGLTLYGISSAMVIQSGLGVEPWDALSQGLSRTFGLGVGVWTNIIGALVLLLWIPLRNKPGLGTVLNVLMIGTVMDLFMAWTPVPEAMWLRWTVLISGVVLNGVATGMYIGAGLGPGPRDGLMTGWAARGHSIRAVRWVIELTVLVIGFLLGATLGIGTLIYAVAIGPLSQIFIPMFDLKGRTPKEPEPGAGRSGAPDDEPVPDVKSRTPDGDAP
ncbi:YitT family protein [Streptomyces sp. NPDC059452]|uniref:membrane protein YczE n=1 Tax=Streptomyces sp. NPDC059452 TaxID=3346835 RepID=UPI003697A258